MKRGTDSVEYAYNALGELVRRKTDGVVDRHFLWDKGQLLALLDGSGNRIAEYAYLPGGEPLSFTTAGGTDYYHVDLRGNVVGLSNGTAAVQQTNYAPWGAVENQTGWSFDSTRLGWKGNVWEGGKTNLYYVRNRWYDPVSRGFISEDPIGIGGGLNTYAYGGNDPVNRADPTGLKDASCEWVSNGLQVAGYTTDGKYTVLALGAWECSSNADDDDNNPLSDPRDQGEPSGLGRSGGGFTQAQVDEIRNQCKDAFKDFAIDAVFQATGLGLVDLLKGGKELFSLSRELSAASQEWHSALLSGSWLLSPEAEAARAAWQTAEMGLLRTGAKFVGSAYPATREASAVTQSAFQGNLEDTALNLAKLVPIYGLLASGYDLIRTCGGGKLK